MIQLIRLTGMGLVQAAKLLKIGTMIGVVIVAHRKTRRIARTR